MIIRRISLIISLIFLMTACKDKSCQCVVDTDSLIQKKETINEIITFNRLEQGVDGYIIILRICDKERNMIEEINLRGEDVIPIMDSIIKNNIYISCVYTNSVSENSEIDIPFENMVLGDGLLNKKRLKYNYIFRGKY